jgi:hypothetical protein
MNWGVLIVAVLTFLSSLLGYLSTRQKIKAVDGKVDGVHTLVNSQHADLVNRVTQLTGTLNEANVDIPDAAPPS